MCFLKGYLRTHVYVSVAVPALWVTWIASVDYHGIFAPLFSQAEAQWTDLVSSRRYESVSGCRIKEKISVWLNGLAGFTIKITVATVLCLHTPCGWERHSTGLHGLFFLPKQSVVGDGGALRSCQSRSEWELSLCARFSMSFFSAGCNSMTSRTLRIQDIVTMSLI